MILLRDDIKKSTAKQKLAEGAAEIPDQQKSPEKSSDRQINLNGIIIDQGFSEEFKIIHPSISSAEKFEAHVREIARSLLPDWDFIKNPLRFVLCDNLEPNAFCYSKSSPPVIGFNRGLFLTRLNGNPPIIDSEDKLAIVLGHELFHFIKRVENTQKMNSKLEEAEADIFAIKLAHKAKFDIKEAVQFYNDLEKTGPKNQSDEWYRVLDDHLLCENRFTLVDATLSAIDKSTGGLPYKPAEIKNDSDFYQSCLHARHSSWLQKRKFNADYENLNTEDKIAFLKTAVDKSFIVYGVRAKEIAKEISALSLDKNNSKEIKLLYSLLDSLLDHQNISVKNKLTAYQAISLLITEGKERNVPLGRLADLNSAIINFVNAKERLKDHACKLIIAVSAEPLSMSRAGIEFLQNIKFAGFKYFSEENRKLKLKLEDIDLEDEYLNHISWRRHITAAKKYPQVGLALMHCGIDDINLYNSKILSDNVKQLLLKRKFPFIISPCAEDQIEDFYLSALPKKPKVERLAEDLCASQREFKLGYISNYENIQDLILNKNTTRQDITAFILGGNPYTHGVLNEPELFYSDIKKFLDINSNELMFNMKSAKTFISMIRDEISQGKEEYISLIRAILLAEEYEYKYTLTNLFTNFCCEEGKNIDDRIYKADETEIPFNQTHVPGINPYLAFLLDQKNSDIFSFDDRLKSLNLMLAGSLNPHFNSSEFAKDGSIAINTNQLDWKSFFYIRKLYYPYIQQISPGADKISPLSWKELEKAANRTNLSPLYSVVFQIEAVCRMFIDDKLTTKEAIALSQVLDLRNDRRLHAVAYKKTSNYNFIRNNYKIDTLCKTWKRLYEQNLLNAETQYASLAVILEKIEANQDPENRIELICYLLRGRLIEHPEKREKAYDIWAKSVLEVYGKDDQTKKYSDNIKNELFRLCGAESGSSTDDLQKLLSLSGNFRILDLLANEIIAQKNLSYDFEKLLPDTSVIEDKNAQIYGIGMEAIINFLNSSPEKRFATLDFLISPLSAGSSEEFISRTDFSEFCRECFYRDEPGLPKEVSEYIKKRSLDIAGLLHLNYWAFPIEARTLVCKSLLYGESADNNAAMEYLLTKIFTQDSPYTEISIKWLKAYVSSLPDYQVPFAISALLVAAKRTSESNLTIGQSLAILLENLGPLEAKAGQKASNHPDVPHDIRQDLERLKFNADRPAVWSVWHWFEESVPVDIQEQVLSLGPILGSASLYATIRAAMIGQSSAVFSILRPYSKEKIERGMEILTSMLFKLESDENSTVVLRELLDSAYHAALSEVNNNILPFNYELASKIYNSTSVNVAGEEISFRAPKLLAHGQGYQMMEEIPGVHLSEFITMPDDERVKKVKIATAVIEISNILTGTFDEDRHGGNIKVNYPVIGNFDLRTFNLTPHEDFEFAALGKVVLDTINSFQEGNSIAQAYSMASSDYREEHGSLPLLIIRVQSALLSLQPMFEGLEKDEIMGIFISAFSQSANPLLTEYLSENIQKLSVLGNNIAADLKFYEIKKS